MLEAMSCGLPVVSFSVGGIPDIIKNNHSGFLCNVNDLECMCEKIIWFYNNKDKIKIFGDNAKVIVEKKRGKIVDLEEIFSRELNLKNIC